MMFAALSERPRGVDEQERAECLPVRGAPWCPGRVALSINQSG
jgi:hypothetical protein